MERSPISESKEPLLSGTCCRATKGWVPSFASALCWNGFSRDAENSEDQVRELIRKLNLQDRVILAGYQENIPDMLSAFEAFCLPSFSEGLPGSVLEAMAAGVPVVGSNVRGIKEVVKNGDTGLFFSSNNDSELADSLKNLLDSKSLARSLAANAFDYVQKMHSKDVWINKISDIFCLKS